MKWEDILKFTPPFSRQLQGRLLGGNIEMFQMTLDGRMYHKMIIVRGAGDKSFYDVLNMGDNETYMGGFRVGLGIEPIIRNIVQTREELREFVREYSEYITVLSFLDSRLHFVSIDSNGNFSSSGDFRNTTEVPMPVYNILSREERENVENIDFGMYDLPVPEFDSGSRQLYDEFIYIYENLEADL
jgi:hypothetical protein